MDDCISELIKYVIHLVALFNVIIM